MALKTVTLKEVSVEKVEYDTRTKDLKVFYANGSIIKYLDVIPDVLENMQGLIIDGVSHSRVVDYMLAVGLTKERRRVSGMGVHKQSITYRVPKYEVVVIKEADAVKASELEEVKNMKEVLLAQKPYNFEKISSSIDKIFVKEVNGNEAKIDVVFKSSPEKYAFQKVEYIKLMDIASTHQKLTKRLNKGTLTDEYKAKFGIGEYLNKNILKNDKYKVKK